MVVEVGVGQVDAVASLFTQGQLLDVAVTPDLAGIPRAIHIHSAGRACGGKIRKKALGISTRTD
jgi:hypothetical protein